MINRKKIIWITLTLTFTGLIYFSWIFLRPVKIIAVHKNDNFSYVLVNHFPVTDQGKIVWWQDNRDKLKNRYGIPSPSSDGNFNITFWLFGDGYMEEDKYERLCFNDMNIKNNCIEKNKVFSVSKGLKSGVNLMVYDGIYCKNSNGEWVKKRFSER